MVFGLIPSWSKSDKNVKYSTINCKVETIKTSKLYGEILQRGQRCIVICNGYYGWSEQQNSVRKKPYFIHLEQSAEIQINDPRTWNLRFTSKHCVMAFKCLRLAALFDKTTISNETIYSFMIITREASNDMSWLHTRMPAVLHTDEQVNVWLNFKGFDADYALTFLFEVGNLVIFPVSNDINRTGNKNITCIKQFDSNEKHEKIKVGSSNFLRQWLKTGQKRKINTLEEDGAKKKMKN